MKRMNKAFTLIEILIVVIILGILAAIVIPQFTEASDDAKVSAVKSDLQTVRSQIELYNFQHDAPLDETDDIVTQLTSKTDADGTVNAAGEFGPYLQQFPTNPYQSSNTVADAAAEGVGWVWTNANGFQAVNSAGDGVLAY
jgi:general secretion pathway protein G